MRSSYHFRPLPSPAIGASLTPHFRLATHNPPLSHRTAAIPEVPAFSAAYPGSDWSSRPGAGGSGAMADPELSAEALRERLLKELGAEHVVSALRGTYGVLMGFLWGYGGLMGLWGP